MGYYVNYRGSIILPDEVNEKVVVQKLKDLNHRHELKTGGQHPASGDPYEDKWFAWLPPKYHEDDSLESLEDMLDLLGFTVTNNEKLDGIRCLYVEYDSKIGAEEYFLQEMAKEGVLIDLEAEGEDGAKWHYLTDDKQLMEQVAEVEWSAPMPVSQRLGYQAEILTAIAKAFATQKDE